MIDNFARWDAEMGDVLSVTRGGWLERRTVDVGLPMWIERDYVRRAAPMNFRATFPPPALASVERRFERELVPYPPGFIGPLDSWWCWAGGGARAMVVYVEERASVDAIRSYRRYA